MSKKKSKLFAVYWSRSIKFLRHPVGQKINTITREIGSSTIKTFPGSISANWIIEETLITINNILIISESIIDWIIMTNFECQLHMIRIYGSTSDFNICDVKWRPRKHNWKLRLTWIWTGILRLFNWYGDSEEDWLKDFKRPSPIYQKNKS